VRPDKGLKVNGAAEGMYEADYFFHKEYLHNAASGVMVPGPGKKNGQRTPEKKQRARNPFAPWQRDDRTGARKRRMDDQGYCSIPGRPAQQEKPGIVDSRRRGLLCPPSAATQ
jgi:hypothetical protein